jgi:hypothetical protein
MARGTRLFELGSDLFANWFNAYVLKSLSLENIQTIDKVQTLHAFTISDKE